MSGLAFIGGSGLYKLDGINLIKWLDIKSPWGEPSDKVALLEHKDIKFYFIPRHGRNHPISPSNINYRANIEVLKQLYI